MAAMGTLVRKVECQLLSFPSNIMLLQGVNDTN